MKKKVKLHLTAGEVDLRALLAKLDFQDTNVVAAAQEQGRLFFEASKLRTQKARLRMNREARLELVRAEVLLAERQSLIAAGQPFTQKELAALVQVNPGVRKAERLLRAALEQEEAAKLLVDAFKHRKEALRIVLEQNRAEIGFGGTVNLRQLKDQLRQKYPGME